MLAVLVTGILLFTMNNLYERCLFNMKMDLYNLWSLSFPGYIVIWAFMSWINRKRGKPIENPEIFKYKGSKIMFMLGFLPQLTMLFWTIFVPINSSTLFRIGLLIYLIGIIINLTALASFSRSTGDLNTNGIYRYSRNPMYVGGFLFILGLNLMGWEMKFASYVFVIVSLIWVGATHWMVLQEESFLKNKNGDIYREYMKMVPRYVGVFQMTKKRAK